MALKSKIKKTLSNFKIVAFLSFFALAIGATLFLTSQQQDIRQNASGLRNRFIIPTKTTIPTLTPTPYRPYTQGGYTVSPSPSSYSQGGYYVSPTPAIICSPNAYISGTYCDSGYTCHDTYCNATGTGYRTQYYSGSTCAHCAPTPTPAPYTQSGYYTATPTAASSGCPGGTSACGNSNYGNLGYCSKNWIYTGDAVKDSWCATNAGGTKSYCYRCQ